ELVGPCPVCGGRDRFSVNPKKNAWNCRGCQVGGHDAVSLVMHAQSCSFLAACEIINGTPPPNRSSSVTQLSAEERRRRAEHRAKEEARRRREEADDRAKRYESARHIWAETEPLGGVGLDYLRARGLDPKFADGELRLHRGLPHPDRGTFPCIVARVCSPQGEGSAVWRIYLKADGSGKAPVANPKLGLGSAAGGAVRIGGLWSRIGITEGVETALAAREIAGGIIPVWAALSTSGMAGFIPPPEIEHVTIYADGDAPKFRKDGQPPKSPGAEAARTLATRLKEQGIEV